MFATERLTALRPPLKWAGGKRWQVPHLLPLWSEHDHRRLVEPFCGGLAVTLGLQPLRAVLNDANPHLINFYRWLQRGLVTRVQMRNDETLFYRHRARFNKLLAQGDGHTAEAAALFYYLNRTGYNGLCRFNQIRRVQRAVWTVRGHHLHQGLQRIRGDTEGLELHDVRR